MTPDRQLDPEVQDLVDSLEQQDPLHTLSVEEARKQQLDSLTDGDDTVESVADVRDLTVDVDGNEVPARIYKPDRTEPMPVVVFFHGGGWVLGNLESHDALCRALTNYSDTMVLSVDYRLAPENPFPAGLIDCYGVVEWVAENGGSVGMDPDQIAVAGVSAGANLAAAVTLIARDEDGPEIAQQTLMCPATRCGFDTIETVENKEGYVLTEADIRWCWEKYLTSHLQGRNPYASPLYACDFSGLPPATVITAGLDLLQDEGRQYADRLEEAGVPVHYRDYDGMVHGFMSRLTGPTKLSQARKSLEDAGNELKRVFDS